MLNRLFKPQSFENFPLTLRISLLVGLLLVGYLVGSTLTRTIPNTSSTAQTNPGELSAGAGAAIVEPPHRVQDFTLTSQTGDPISLSDLRGRAVLMFFGYTHCPDVCPTTLADYRRVKQAMGADADNVAFVFISVDGARDTPDVVAQYLNHFDPEFIGMTGSEADLRRVGAEYGLIFQQETAAVPAQDGHGHEDQHEEGLDAENYFVGHTSPSFLIDPQGYLRLVYFYGAEPEVMADGIRQMLQ